MKIKNHPVLGLLFILGYPISAHAQLSASVTGTTDYIWRGYSK